jgi:DNA-binding protein HU-beta
MNKKELTECVVNKTGLSIKDVNIVIECIVDEIKKSLMKNDVVRINNFGSFHNKICASKQGRDLSKGEKIFIPEHYKPVWTVSKQLKAEIRENVKIGKKRK